MKQRIQYALNDLQPTNYVKRILSGGFITPQRIHVKKLVIVGAHKEVLPPKQSAKLVFVTQNKTLLTQVLKTERKNNRPRLLFRSNPQQLLFNNVF